MRFRSIRPGTHRDRPGSTPLEVVYTPQLPGFIRMITIFAENDLGAMKYRYEGSRLDPNLD
jgi:hypothetical protein